MSLKSAPLRKKLSPHINTLLKIALFDIWICNDDRSFNNHNLLIDSEGDFGFIPIDHVDIFHSSTLEKGWYTISKEESIYSIPLFKSLITNKLNFSLLYQELENYLYFCALKCKNSLDEIFQEIPSDWSLDTEEMTNSLEVNLFNDKWTRDVMDCFITYTQSVLNDHGNKL